MEPQPATSKPKKKPFNVTVAGTNRGARGNLGAFERLNNRLTSTELALTKVDPVAGRAEEVAELARGRGLQADAIEGAIEDVLLARPSQPLVLNLDRPQAIADTLLLSEKQPMPILGLLLVALPDRLLGIRFTLPAKDAAARTQARLFFERLATFAARAGSKRVVGVDAPVGNQLVEPLYRRWFAEHTDQELGRLIANVEPEAFPMEVTLDGTTTLPMLVAESDSFGEPNAVVVNAIRRSPTPVPKDCDLLVVEVTPDAMRLHEARRRATDGRVVVGRTDFLNADLLQVADEHSVLHDVPNLSSAIVPARDETLAITTVQAAQQIESAEQAPSPFLLLVAALATVSRAEPVYTTD